MGQHALAIGAERDLTIFLILHNKNSNLHLSMARKLLLNFRKIPLHFETNGSNYESH